MLAPGDIDDDASIGASVPGVPFEDATVAAVLDGRFACEVEVIIPALGIRGTARTDGMMMEGAVTRDGRLIDKRIIDCIVVAMDEEELGARKGVSTGSMRSQKMGPEAPTSKDVGGSKKHT